MVLILAVVKGFIKVGGQTNDINVSKETQWIKSQTWNINEAPLISEAYPEYLFESVADPSQSYYARNDTLDFSNVRVYALGDVSANTIVPIPTRIKQTHLLMEIIMKPQLQQHLSHSTSNKCWIKSYT